MLTQPVLVARLSTHAWALGKGPALFSLRHRDEGRGGCEKAAAGVCVYVCVYIVLKEQTWGALKYTGWRRWCLLMIIIELAPLLHLSHSLPTSVRLLLQAPLSMVLKVSSHILCMSFESSRIQSLAALQKRCIQFVSTRSVPALGGPSSEGWSPIIQKAAGNTACS